jgi:hypothetical protein
MIFTHIFNFFDRFSVSLVGDPTVSFSKWYFLNTFKCPLNLRCHIFQHKVVLILFYDLMCEGSIIMSFFFLSFFFFSGVTGVGTQDLELVRQVLYHLSHIPSTIFALVILVIFLNRFSLFVQANLF